MRVVAGQAGGIPLYLPPSPVRPTMDRVREAIFSSLGERVTNARVLDLFAGAGSLGIESLSRGAASAVFVDQARPCTETIRRNLDKCRLAGEVHTMDVEKFLSFAENHPDAFDLIFADPPYSKNERDRDWATLLMGSRALRQILVLDGLLVLETFHNWKFPGFPGWEERRNKRYGDTSVRILSRTE